MAPAPAWLKIVPLSNESSQTLTHWRTRFRLGSGELATILLAKELAADLAIIDEKKARQLAQTEKVQVIGTLGILEESYRRKYVSDLRACYQSLLTTGTYIAPGLLNRSLLSFGLGELEHT